MPIDKELIEQLVRKDHDAYNTFYLETVDMFYRYVASRYVLSSAAIEDIVSAFYVKFWRVVERYDDAYAFETYMWTVFRNMLKDYFKKQRLQILPDTRDGADEEWDEASLLGNVEDSFRMEDITEAMQQLDELSYQILFLRYIEDAAYEDIAHAM